MTKLHIYLAAKPESTIGIDLINTKLVCSEGGPEVRSVLCSIEIQRVGMLHRLASKIYEPKESLLVRVPQQ